MANGSVGRQRSGTNSHNNKSSIHRKQSMKQQMASQGLGLSQISINPESFGAQLVGFSGTPGIPANINGQLQIRGAANQRNVMSHAQNTKDSLKHENISSSRRNLKNTQSTLNSGNTTTANKQGKPGKIHNKRSTMNVQSNLDIENLSQHLYSQSFDNQQFQIQIAEQALLEMKINLNSQKQQTGQQCQSFQQ